MRTSCLKTFLILTMIVVTNFTFSQTNKAIVGRTWDVCSSNITMIDETCNYYVTYTFNADGTYTDSRQYTVGDITANYRGTWKLKKNQLTLIVARENGIRIPPSTKKIIWVNNTTFYTIDKEGFFGPKVYTFYQARF